jgi:hypothetical protein
MKWQGLLVLSLVASNLGLGGCQTKQGNFPASNLTYSDFLAEASESAPLTRAQKPEQARSTARFLKLDSTAPGRAAQILATVNGEAILEEEVKAAATSGLALARSEAERAQVIAQKLNDIIDRELVLQEAFARLEKVSKYLDILKKAASTEFEKNVVQRMMKSQHLTTDEEFQKFVREQNIPLDIIRRQWERDFIALEYQRHRLEPHVQRIGHLQIAEYYERHPEEFQVTDSVEWQDIFIAVARHPSRQAARQFAEVLIARIRRGEDFVRLAKEFDNGESCLRENAQGLGHKRGEIQPTEAEPILFGLRREGEVGPLVELETGFHIVRLIKRQYAGRLPFDEKVQTQIRDKLRNEVFQRERKRLVNELKRKAVIETAIPAH